MILDAMEYDPDMEPSYANTPPPRDGNFFNPSNRGRRGRLTTGVSFQFIHEMFRIIIWIV